MRMLTDRIIVWPMRQAKREKGTDRFPFHALPGASATQ